MDFCQDNIAKKSSSVRMRMPSFFAFSSLAGPMFSPAKIKLVLDEMLPTFLPPFFSISSLYSSREWWANTPLMTMDSQANLSVYSLRFSSLRQN